jgi:surfactin synthase thioesterase subunit
MAEWIMTSQDPRKMRQRKAEQLLLFPCAGGGVSAVASISKLASEYFDVWALRLPGRESLYGHAPDSRFAETVQRVARDAARILDGRPTFFIGHSFGAALAFAVARQLGPSGPVRGIILASRRSPSPIASGPDELANLGDADLLAAVTRVQGADPADPATSALFELTLPALRGDLLLDQQADSSGYFGQIALPLTAMTGSSDPWVTPDEVSAWAGFSTGPFRFVNLHASHFLLDSHAPDVMTALLAQRDAARLCA